MKLSLLFALIASTVVSSFAQISPADPSAEPHRIIPNPTGEYSDEARMFQGIPGIACAPQGRLWATWYGGKTGEMNGNYVMVATSGDQGKSWSKVKFLVHAGENARTFDPTLWLDPTNRLWLFWAHKGAREYTAGVWAMTCDNPDEENPAWSEPRRICGGIMLNKPTVLKSGEWLLPVSIWRGKFVKEITGAYAVSSKDQGKTFTPLGRLIVPEPERTFDEHIIVEKKDGSLWMLVRTRSGIGESTSQDGGKTWSEFKPSSIPHVSSRFFIGRLPSGNLLLIRNNPPATEKKRSHLTAFVSEDDGATWKGGLLLDERLSVTYPDAAIMPDGTIYAVFDFERNKAKQIFLAIFTEKDVLSGKWDSSEIKKPLLVNQALGVVPKAKQATAGAVVTDD